MPMDATMFYTLKHFTAWCPTVFRFVKMLVSLVNIFPNELTPEN